jgi:hypothetical protein
MAPPIRLFLADVDGTLVTQDKVLTDRAVAAVAKLKQAGILFAVTSGRPPRGMSMLVEPLQLSMPIAAFNGGVYVHPDMSVIEQQVIPDEVTPTVIELLGAHGLDAWIYRGADWFIRDPKAPHVARETWTVKFDPTVTGDFASVSNGVAKITGVSDDYDAVQKGVDADLPDPARADRHDRRPAQRRAHVRPLRAQHRHGQREPRGPGIGPPRHHVQRGRGLRQRGRAVRPALRCHQRE